MGRAILIAVGVLVGGFLLFILIGALSPQPTYRSVAADTAGDCIKAKGNGGWQASSGIPLEKYCQMVGDVEALKRDKAEHPENY